MSDTSEKTEAPAADEAEALDIYAFDTDAKAESEGVWVTVLGARFLIRSWDSAPVKRVRTQQIVRNGKLAQAGRGVLPQATIQANEIELLNTILLDWQDVPHPDTEKRKAGEKLAFSAEARTALLSPPGRHMLRSLLLNEAQSIENFRVAAAEAAAGNSSRSSAGS